MVNRPVLVAIVGGIDMSGMTPEHLRAVTGIHRARRPLSLPGGG